MTLQPKNRRRRIVVLVAGVVVLAAAGVVVGIDLSGTETSAVDRLEKVLDAIPLPPGTKQTGQDASPESSPITVERSYLLPDPKHAGVEIVAALKGARYRPVTLVGGEDDPLGWTDATRTPSTGYLAVLPPGYHGTGGIQFNWVADVLTIVVDDVTFPRQGSK